MLKDFLRLREAVSGVTPNGHPRAPRLFSEVGNAVSVCKNFSRLVLSGVLSALVGCSSATHFELPVIPVSGKVMMEGKPLSDAMVILVPYPTAAAGQLAARGTTNAEGDFQATTYRNGDGAAVGKYKVTVQFYKTIKVEGNLVPGPNVLNEKFANPATTPFELEVVKDKVSLPILNVHP